MLSTQRRHHWVASWIREIPIFTDGHDPACARPATSARSRATWAAFSRQRWSKVPPSDASAASSGEPKAPPLPKNTPLAAVLSLSFPFRLPQLPSRLHSLFPSPPVSSWSSTRCRSTASPSSQTRGSSWEALQLHLPGGHRAMPSHGAHSAWNCWQFPRALRPQSPRFLSLVISSRWLLVSGHFCPPRHLPGRNWMACSRPGGILFGKCCASGTKPTVLSSVQAGKYAYE